MNTFVFAVLALVSISSASRIVTLASDLPAPTNNLAGILDANFSRALASGLYSQAQISARTADDLAFFKNQFGIDFALGFFNPALGSYHLPNVALYPYGTGLENQQTYRVVDDSANPDRENGQGWSAVLSGHLALFSQGGPLGGLASFQTASAGDILARLDFNLIDNKGKDNANAREIIPYESLSTTKQTLNSWGKVEQHGVGKVVAAGKAGLASTHTFLVDSVTGTTQHVRDVLTWH